MLGALLLSGGSLATATPIPSGPDGFKSQVAPFFEANCIACHGPKQSKGKMTLHTLDGNLEGGGEIDRWEKILDVRPAGEMPPEDEPQPDAAERQPVAKWSMGACATS